MDEAKVQEFLLEYIENLSDWTNVGSKTVLKATQEHFGIDLKPHKKTFLAILTKTVQQVQSRKSEEESSPSEAEEESDEDIESESAVEEIERPKRVVKKTVKKPVAKKPTAKKQPKKRQPATTTFEAPSEALVTYMGSHEFTKNEAAAKIRLAMKELPRVKRGKKSMVELDENLNDLFKRKFCTSFEVPKLLKSHYKKWVATAECDEPELKKAREMAKKKGAKKTTKAKANTEDKPKRKQPEREISDEMQALVGATKISRPQCVKKIWEHIKDNDLQDEDDKRRIINSTPEMKDVFNCESMTMFELNKLITPHFL
eukprot:TRINITY_DN8304_c0_g1_i1.p1 TRINITY_DN8304_c0_g1~~TRINITY_DN8304_c0_g1_i1.p1  ORF type:complete len:315 (-),score=108.24 TRINITY_DN8304_c0_g1_i1:174-1118(-)